MLGLTIKRPEVIKEDDGSFQSLRPNVSAPPDAIRLAEVYSPPVVDHTPAVPINDQIIEKAKEAGKNKLAELFERAAERAKQSALLIEVARRRETNGPSKPRKSSSSSSVSSPNVIPAATKSEPQILFSEEDECENDEEFIKRTLNGDYHSTELKRIFFAAGIQKYLDIGLLYPAACDQLRREAMIRLRASKMMTNNPSTFSRSSVEITSSEVSIYVAGLPTMDQMIAKENAEQDAKKRKRNELWLSQELRMKKV